MLRESILGTWCGGVPWSGWRWQLSSSTCDRGRHTGSQRDIFEKWAGRNGWAMPREAKLFSSSAGSVVRGYLKFRANITPRWIRNAQTSRKRIEPEIVRSLSALKRVRKTRPRARVAIKDADTELKAILRRWETAYDKENFYRGIRILLELQRNGTSNL